MRRHRSRIEPPPADVAPDVRSAAVCVAGTSIGRTQGEEGERLDVPSKQSILHSGTTKGEERYQTHLPALLLLKGDLTEVMHGSPDSSPASMEDMVRRSTLVFECARSVSGVLEND